MRTAVVAVAASLSAALLAGCGTGPNQIGAAAVVGDTVISVDFVQAWWDRVLANPETKEQRRSQGQFDDLGRAIVAEAVRHELLREVAEREQLSFDEAQVSELIDELGGEQAAVESTNSFYDSSTIRERARDQLLMVALGRKYFERTSITFDVTSVPTRDEALAKAEELARDPDNASEIIRRDADTGAGANVDVTQHVGDNVNTAIETPLFSVPAGNVLAFTSPEQAEQSQWNVVVFRERSTDADPSDRPEASTVDQMDDGRLAFLGLRLLALLARDIDVRVSPRYGVWSNVYLELWQNEAEIPAVVVPFARAVGE